MAADISRHQWMDVSRYFILNFFFFFFFRNPPVFRPSAVLQRVGQACRPLFGLFERNIICDVLIGQSWSADWQPGALYCALVLAFTSTHLCVIMLPQQGFQCSHFPRGLFLHVDVQVGIKGVCVLVSQPSGVEHDLRAPPMICCLHAVHTHKWKSMVRPYPRMR